MRRGKKERRKNKKGSRKKSLKGFAG